MGTFVLVSVSEEDFHNKVDSFLMTQQNIWESLLDLKGITCGDSTKLNRKVKYLYLKAPKVALLYFMGLDEQEKVYLRLPVTETSIESGEKGQVFKNCHVADLLPLMQVLEQFVLERNISLKEYLSWGCVGSTTESAPEKINSLTFTVPVGPEVISKTIDKFFPIGGKI